MCGLAGEIRFDGRRADVGACERVTDSMADRGPDGYGIWARGPVALGHRRLSIIDLSAAGSQPMVDAALGLTVVFNGCIYNYRQLRAELEGHGHRFFSTSDTEVVGKAYAQWGTSCVDHFLGMFAIAIAEHASGRLILARDRLGIKPLYLDETPDRLRFASALPALLRGGGTDTSIDPTALAYYLTFHSVVPAPLTILKGIRKLPPATVRVVEPDGTWHRAHLLGTRLQPGPGPGRLDRPGLGRRRCTPACGRPSSGGWWPTSRSGCCCRAGWTPRWSSPCWPRRVSTTCRPSASASTPPAGSPATSSSTPPWSRGSSSTDHHRIPIDSARLLPGIDAAIRAMSEPMVSHDCVAFYLLSEDVARSVKVVQSGQGADEVLGGYDWYPPLAGVPRDHAVEAYSQVFFDRRWSAMSALVNPEWLLDSDAPTAFIADQFGRPGAETAVDAALRNDTTIMLVDDPVKRVDNMTMAWGLEARVPFLDHELVELAGRIPPELKLADGGKGVLKRAARGLVPDAVIDRTKGYFPVPAIRQLEGPYLERVRDALSDPRARDRAPVPPGNRQRAAGRPEHHPDHAGLQRAVAARPAGDVAAGTPRWLRRAGVG